MVWDKKKLILIGGIFLLLILILVLIPSKKPKTQVVTNNKDFDTKDEPTNTPTPTKIPTNTPTLIPTLTPTVVPTLEPTMIPTATLTPTRRPTRVPTATPTPDMNIYATGVVLSETEISLTVNQSKQITVRVEPNDTTDQSVYWSSSDGNIATVTTDGWITGESLGETVITARTSNNKTTLVKVKVINKQPTVTPTIRLTPTPTPVDYPTRIDLSLGSLILKVNETKQLYVKYQPMNIRNKTVTWTSDDKSIVTVTNSGLVKGIKLGITTIKVVTANNLSRTATVIVLAN